MRQINKSFISDLFLFWSNLLLVRISLFFVLTNAFRSVVKSRMSLHNWAYCFWEMNYYSDYCVFISNYGIYCIINAVFRLPRDCGRGILVSESVLRCLVCFHFKLIILSNSLSLHYSLIPLSSLIKRASIFSLIFIYLFSISTRDRVTQCGI